jgi:hypothetical protein
MLKNFHRLIVSGLVLLVGLLPPTASMVYGADLQHVLGTVTAIDAKHLEVKTARGPVVSVLLTKQVKFKNKNNPKLNDPPTVGDRVIIEASKDDKNKKVTATIVHYSPVRHASPPH